jgi:hypothetical protein
VCLGTRRSTVVVCSQFITFHADVYGNLIAFDYRTSNYDCWAGQEVETVRTQGRLQSKGRISLGRAGEKPRPIRSQEAPTPTAATADGGGGGGKPGEPAPQQSFLGKYWFYILIAVLFLNPFGGGGGGGAAAAK